MEPSWIQLANRQTISPSAHQPISKSAVRGNRHTSEGDLDEQEQVHEEETLLEESLGSRLAFKFAPSEEAVAEEEQEAPIVAVWSRPRLTYAC